MKDDRYCVLRYSDILKQLVAVLLYLYIQIVVANKFSRSYVLIDYCIHSNVSSITMHRILLNGWKLFHFKEKQISTNVELANIDKEERIFTLDADF